MFDDMIEKEEDLKMPEVTQEYDKLKKGGGPRTGTVSGPRTGAGTGQKYPKATTIIGSGPNVYPCNIPDCRYYSKWTIDHPANFGIARKGSGLGNGSITPDNGLNPEWCMACEDFEGVTVRRKK